jgi:DNA-binding GntR family transcriptional regulator
VRVTDLEIVLNRVSPVPLYHQLARQLVAAIEGGVLPKGAFLENELDLADKWHVSRPTVRRAIQDLVDAGMLVRRRGVGTQVVNDQVRRPFKLTSLFDDLAAIGREPATSVLTLEIVPADDETADALELAPGTGVVHIERTRSVGGQPLAILRNWLIADVAGALTADDLRSRGLYALLRDRGVRPHSAVQRLGAIAASPADAVLLELPVGAPLVTMRRIMQDDGGRIVEFGDHRYDAAHYSVELNVIETS